MSETPDVTQAGEASGFDQPAPASTSEEFRYGLNLPLADKILDWINRSEHEALRTGEPSWEQDLWFQTPMSLDGTRKLDCGTYCCVAGYIAADAKVVGNTPVDGDFEPMPNLMYHKENHLGITWEDWCAELGWDPNDSYWLQQGIPWEFVGAFFLGITTLDARDLFAASNMRSDIEGLLARFKDKYPA